MQKSLYVSLARRLGAISYDLLILITLLVLVSMLISIPLNMNPEHLYSLFIRHVYILFHSYFMAGFGLMEDKPLE